MGNPIQAQELSLKDYTAVIIKDLEVPSGSPAPESAGSLMAEKAVYQIKRYNEKYRLFDGVGRSFISGGEFTGTASFAAHYQFINQETGKIIYEIDLRTKSTGA